MDPIFLLPFSPQVMRGISGNGLWRASSVASLSSLAPLLLQLLLARRQEREGEVVAADASLPDRQPQNQRES